MKPQIRQKDHTFEYRGQPAVIERRRVGYDPKKYMSPGKFSFWLIRAAGKTARAQTKDKAIARAKAMIDALNPDNPPEKEAPSPVFEPRLL